MLLLQLYFYPWTLYLAVIYRPYFYTLPPLAIESWRVPDLKAVTVTCETQVTPSVLLAMAVGAEPRRFLLRTKAQVAHAAVPAMVLVELRDVGAPELGQNQGCRARSVQRNRGVLLDVS